MPREWTEQQRHAITAQGGSILVSAAAGSGKTAVLVERVIRMITAADHPVDADAHRAGARRSAARRPV